MTTQHLMRRAMGAARLTTPQLIGRTGLDKATVSRLFNGVATSMRIETLDLIQHATNVPIETLFEWYRLPADAKLLDEGL